MRLSSPASEASIWDSSEPDGEPSPIPKSTLTRAPSFHNTGPAYLTSGTSSPSLRVGPSTNAAGGPGDTVPIVLGDMTGGGELTPQSGRVFDARANLLPPSRRTRRGGARTSRRFRLAASDPMVRRIPVSGLIPRRETARPGRSPERTRLRLPRARRHFSTSRAPPRKRSGIALLSFRPGSCGARRYCGGARLWVGLPASRRSILRSAATSTASVHRRNPRSRRSSSRTCRGGSICRRELRPASSDGLRAVGGRSRASSRRR